MKRDNERPTSAIWLLGDSPPPYYEHCLDEPLDWRFPTRHNIWTPIETVINGELFREMRSRIDDSKFYVRNAVQSRDTWKHEDELDKEVLEFGKLAEKHQPFLILTFGGNAFEFARRSRGGEPKICFSAWGVPEIQEQFDKGLANLRMGKVNVLPLLHVSIARQFKYCHQHFKGDQTDYFKNVGRKLATILKEHRSDPRLSGLWCD